MAYTKQTWENLPSQTTPINADRLTHIEDGIFNAASTADTAASDASSAISGLADKVDKVEGKGLSTNDFTDALKTKLDNIETGAEVNVQSDWNEADSSNDAFILNKPTLGTSAYKNSTSVVTDSTDLVESGAVKDIVGWGNKNKLAGFELGSINRTTGQEEASTSIARTINYIPVTAGEECTISGSITVNLRVFTYNSSKTYISSDGTISISGGEGHYTIPSGVAFVRFIGTASGIGSDIQLEVGTTATAYEPYHASVEESKADNSVIAPTENGTTASQAYAVGSHFIRNGAFCTVTTAISSGESLVGSSKFTSGDVADTIKDLIVGVSDSQTVSISSPNGYGTAEISFTVPTGYKYLCTVIDRIGATDSVNNITVFLPIDNTATISKYRMVSSTAQDLTVYVTKLYIKI